jgi:hypothetical protein
MLIMLINISNRMLINILNQPVGDARRACISGSGSGSWRYLPMLRQSTAPVSYSVPVALACTP